MTKIESYKDLEVWRLAMSLVKDRYRITKAFPADERFGMISQVRRASVSIPANIAEGYGRDQTGNFIQFLRIAHGSTRELETLFLLCIDLELSVASECQKCLETIMRVSMMLRALIRKLESR